MKKHLVLYCIAIVIASVVVCVGIDEARNSLVWQATIIAEGLDNSLYTFVSYGVNPFFYTMIWIALGSIMVFVFHLFVDTDE